jgi:hypothetical protein
MAKKNSMLVEFNLIKLDISDIEFEVLAAVVTKSSVFWDRTACDPLKFRRNI